MPYVNPKLRPVQTHLIEHRGKPAILLRDPLQLSPHVMAIPQDLGLFLALCDGSRDVSALRAALLIHAGLNVSLEALQRLVDQLDEALLLDNERSAQAKASVLQTYRAAPHRHPSSAGTTYPEDPNEARAFLDAYLQAAAQNPQPLPDGLAEGRGLVCPHIDYARGGLVYAQAWQAMSKAAQEAELIVIFGTDHLGSAGQLTLTRQNYATPWGSLPTDQETVSAVIEAIGEEAALGEELHHLGEHSIELGLVWLHHIRQGSPCSLVPILCGGFESFVSGDSRPEENTTFASALEALCPAIGSRRTLVVAAADLAHVGPAFGDMLPLDFMAQMRLQSADEKCIQQICQGNAEAFFAEIKSVKDKYRVCGLPPIYLALRLLEDSMGHRLGYLQCPADEQQSSWVSICGVALT